MPEITPDELNSRLIDEDERPIVLDVRHESKFEDWHIPGSINVGTAEVDDDELTDLELGPNRCAAE